MMMMMSKEEGEGDEFDSLFEGMILFNPSELGGQPPYGHGHDHDDSNEQQCPVSITETTTQQPLDENLFSDLTVVSPIQTQTLGLEDEEPTGEEKAHPPPYSISRQLSRKKKRAGLRIGYGRDAAPQPDTTDTNTNASTNLELEETTLQADLESPFRARSASPPLPSLSSSSDGISTPTNALQHRDSMISDAHPPPPPPADAANVEDEKATSSFSIEERYEQITTQISQKLIGARELAASVSAAKKDSIRRRRKAADDLNLASLKHCQLENKLEDACEAEDFEMAERLSENLAAAEMEKTGFINALRDAEAECDAIDLKMQQILEHQIAIEKECVSLLKQFSIEAANDGEVVLKKADMEFSKGMDDWFSSAEALEVKKMELEIETHLVNEAHVVMNDSIEDLIIEEKKEKELLCKKRDVLINELEKLLVLVKEKEKAIAENDYKIKEVEIKMGNVVTGYEDMRSSIGAKCDILQSGLSHMESESEALFLKKKELDHFISQEADRGAKLLELARVSADEARAYEEQVSLRKRLMLISLKSREDRVRLAKTERQLAEDVHMLKQEVSASRASLQELASAKSTIQQEISSCKQKIFFIDKRVPELEAEKKVAAAARNFKEAARIAAEAKTLGLEKEGVHMKMEGAMLKLEEHEEQIKDTVCRLHDTEELILSKEEEVALTRFQWLILASGAAAAERSAALELGDIEEANILYSESEAAYSEARKLKPSHNNFSEEELLNLPKSFISMELVSNLGGRELKEFAASVDVFHLNDHNQST